MNSKKPPVSPEEQERKDKHVQFTKAFVEAFQEQFSQPYVHQGAKDGSPLKAFILAAPAVTVDRWTQVARATWNSPNRWQRENVVTIAMLCSQWNQVASKVQPAGQTPTDDRWI